MTGYPPPGNGFQNQPNFPPPQPQPAAGPPYQQQPYPNQQQYQQYPQQQQYQQYPQAPAGHQPPNAGQYNNLSGITMALSILLGIGAALALLFAFPFFNRAGVLDDFVAGSAQLSDIEEADGLVGGLGLVMGLAVVATGVLFIVWQFQYAKNSERLHGKLGLGPGWAIGGWFVPLGNLVLPFLQIRHSARASSAGQVPGLVTGWTVTYILASVTFAAASGMRPSGSDILTGSVQTVAGKFTQADNTAGVALLILAAAGVLGALMVRKLHQNQQQAFQVGTPSGVQQRW